MKFILIIVLYFTTQTVFGQTSYQLAVLKYSGGGD